MEGEDKAIRMDTIRKRADLHGGSLLDLELPFLGREVHEVLLELFLELEHVLDLPGDVLLQPLLQLGDRQRLRVHLHLENKSLR
jgi:hypothetical protein